MSVLPIFPTLLSEARGADVEGRRMATPLELLIESLAYGGDGVAHDGGRAVFVPLTAPGDRVRARELPTRAGARRAELEAVVSAGTDRVAPPCPLAGRCGGCHHQHLAYDAQVRAKGEIVAALLSRSLGHAEVAPCVPSPLPLRYRRRARWHPAGRGRLGFSERAGPRVVPVDDCLLVEPGVQAAYLRVRDAASLVPRLRSLGLDANEDGRFVVDVRTEGPPSPGALSRSEAMLALGAAGVTVGEERKATTRAFGEPVLRDPGGLRVRPDCFAQANRLGARLLVEHALGSLRGASNVLELFCGAGTFTLPLLERGARVLGVESWVPSLDLLAAAAAERDLSPRLVAGDAVEVARSLASEGRAFDAVLLDPPREGAKGVSAALAKLAPRVVYVSCDPATLARDARELAQHGFALESAVPLDLFPQTFHVEVVATFRRA